MEWKFKKDAKPVPMPFEDFWYDLADDGGDIKPEELLADKEQIQKLRKAIELVKSFAEAMEDAGLFGAVNPEYM